MRGSACQQPITLVYVAGAPAHKQRDRESDPWVKMEGDFSVGHLVQPMRLMAEQCTVSPQNLLRAVLQLLFESCRMVHRVRGGAYTMPFATLHRVVRAASLYHAMTA